ncbi:TPA: EAL domain-containing protein [Citrobacter werkmanii]|nr:EAL domain-containing protein [Citrobacter werkmanii]
MYFTELKIQKAIDKKEFIQFYQPIVNHDYEIVGGEVLARWRNPELGLLCAGHFIKSIESSGLMESFTHQLLADFFRKVTLLNIKSDQKLFISVNVSLSMIMEPVFRIYLLRLYIQLQQTGIDPVFEITERENIQLYPQASDIFSQLKNAGLRFMVDDFGTGFAGPSLLVVTQASFIKIDIRFFTDRFIEDAVNLAKRAGAKVIAEGVETKEQASRIRRHGVDFIQGFLTGAPMPFEIFNHKLGRQRIAHPL